MADGDGFLWVGNHPALDLCNTRPVLDGEPTELLRSGDDVARWARHVGIDVAAGEVDPATVRWVRDLREALRVLLDPTGPGGDVGALNALLARDRGVRRVEADGRTVRLVATGRDGHAGGADHADAAQLRLDLAAAALDVLARDPGRVRRCGRPACVLLFLDTSKGGRRRWCDMAVCGNRAKVAAHYARHRTPTPS